MPRLSGKSVIIVHGWSDNWSSMRAVGKPLRNEGARVEYVNYDSREDRAVYEDFAEGLEKELRRLERRGRLTGSDGELGPRMLNAPMLGSREISYSQFTASA